MLQDMDDQKYKKIIRCNFERKITFGTKELIGLLERNCCDGQTPGVTVKNVSILHR